ncbi:GSCFA domain-containing protein [Aequorivita sp. H23M31]|uniref:GSCFA domain-containing protein n=1 Tax=Aequorivita ciconiae TaxID=2494375 RepID=A0A410G6C3_9FLAO|nr:GSCFA domain-containing protein [Aequorivita sp. H23M31]QAA82826.1 GSCFA domain-containing protein [Aequorivita sp. H23M31]
MKLQTEIELRPEENQIDYSSKILLLGSCFSENIGAKFDYYKFQNLQNPFGVIFNPISIEKLIARAIENNRFSDRDIFQHNGIWKCFEVHSELSSLDKYEILENLNSALQNLQESLLTSSHIIFTFGTSWVSRNTEKDEIVANCHKLPQKDFNKELLSIKRISESLINTAERISAINPNAIVINTISPVRHIKDGFTENSLSKAHLISAINGLKSSLVYRKPYYFPSYEIMMDELRDYRYYSEDLIHPNKTAIEIIWEKFLKVWIDPETKFIQKEIASIQIGLFHKPFNPESVEHHKFQEKLQQKISSIKEQFPHIKF